MQEDVKYLLWQIGLVATLIAAGLTVVNHAIQSWRDRVADRRKQILELSVTIGLANWKEANDRIQRIRADNVNTDGTMRMVPMNIPAPDLLAMIDETSSLLQTIPNKTQNTKHK